MKTRAKIDHEQQLTTYIVTGILDWEKIKSVIQDQLPGYLPKNTLWDMREANIGEISLSALEEIIGLMKRITARTGGKTAVVPPPDARESIIGRLQKMIENSRDALPMEIRFFDNLDDALKWVRPLLQPIAVRGPESAGPG